MTACVNRKHTKKVAAVVTASLVGALSLGVAPVAAMAEGVDMQAEDLSSVWESTEFTWNVEPQKDGSFKVETGNQLILKSAKDINGPVSMADLTVVYVKDTNNDGKLNGTDKIVKATTPETVGTYYAAVVNDNISTEGVSGKSIDEFRNGAEYTGFQVQVTAKSLEGSFAYQGDDVNDTTFMYTGYDFRDAGDADKTPNIHIADKDGNDLEAAGSGVTVKIYDNAGTLVNGSITKAGTYTVSLVADSDTSVYTDSYSFTFTVDKIDLSNSIVAVDPVEVAAANVRFDATGKFQQSEGVTRVYVNGEEVKPGVLNIQASTVEVIDPSNPDNPLNGINPGGTYNGSWLAKVNAVATSTDTNVKNAEKTVTFYVVKDLLQENVDFKTFYAQENLGSDLYVEVAKGESFDPSQITVEGIGAYAGKSFKDITVTVTKDGEAVTDYSVPGTYSVRIDVNVPDDLSYAGSKTFKLIVVGKRYSAQPKAWATIGGKDASNPVEYNGKAFTPVVTVKDGSTVLAEGEDYTVVYKDAKGEVVEEMVEPGKYTAVIDFGQANYYELGVAKDVENIEFTVEITKAEIESAKADKDVYDVKGETIAPTFTAYTNKDLKGLSVAIDPATAGATYHKVKENAKGEPLYIYNRATHEWELQLEAGDLGASDLTESGWYVADLVVPADDAHFEGEVTSEPFQISEYAKFSDVDASAWYADAVYNAADLGYMTGISGTDLFMPVADITRAELAKVFGNMAGEAFSPIYTPTKFDDVDPLAWYAGAVAWADEAGIVTGYDDTTFGPSDKATREQVAVMLYRYAKGQGKGVTVEDADATLAAYKDADQVSDWAKEAMAWAVDNGIFGQGTDELWAKQNIQRCAVATIAVRFQPEALPEA